MLWHCWLGHLTRKNPSPIWLIMWDVKPCLTQLKLLSLQKDVWLNLCLITHRGAWGLCPVLSYCICTWSLPSTFTATGDLRFMLNAWLPVRYKFSFSSSSYYFLAHQHKAAGVKIRLSKNKNHLCLFFRSLFQAFLGCHAPLQPCNVHWLGNVVIHSSTCV